MWYLFFASHITFTLHIISSRKYDLLYYHSFTFPRMQWGKKKKKRQNCYIFFSIVIGFLSHLNIFEMIDKSY